MQRNLQRLADPSYDVLIVGGGIYGACLAWEAASRGLSVALVEKQDFGSATSANSLKIIHGGLRYLQHADFKRMRESIRERKNLLRIAPHLIHPLPILVPTYGHGVKGREVMAIALLMNDMISCDRNWSMPDASHHIPTGRVISQADCLQVLPGLPPEGLTGGAVFTDAQVYNSERLTLAFLRSASDAGAQIANYVKVCDFLKRDNQIVGAVVQDELTGQQFDLQAKFTINTSGPWIHELQALAKSEKRDREVLLAKAVNLVVPQLFEDMAVGLSSRNAYGDQDALINKGSRFLFAAPWREFSMLGTWYFPYRQSPDHLQVSEAELQSCIDDINSAYPTANLTLADVKFVHTGLLPSQGISTKTGDVQLTKHYQLIDHRQQGISGLLTVSGVKYTTARDVAEKALNRASQLMGRSLPLSQTHKTPVFGGDIKDLAAVFEQARQSAPASLPDSTLKALIYTYGTEYTAIVASLTPESDSRAVAEQVLAAQTRYAVREEMAQRLLDVVLRRTELGSAGKPADVDIRLCAEIMAAELNWDSQRRQIELQQVHQFYADKLPKTPESVVTISGM